MASKRKVLQRAPVDRIERWPVEKLVPYAQNPRTHSPQQIEQIAASMKEFGQAQLVVVDEKGIIIAGHGRVLAAQKLGWKMISVGIAIGWSEPQKRAYRIADNQIALTSAWDNAFLSSEIEGLELEEFDLNLLGFDQAEMSRLLSRGQIADPDDVPKPPSEPIVRQGDTWALGDHRVACGDSTKPDAWRAMLGSERAAVVFTDPPYGVSYQGGDFDIIEGDRKRRDDLFQMLQKALQQMMKHAANDAAFYIWHASSTRQDFSDAMNAAGLAERQYLIWVKPSIVLGHADYSWQHEPCFYASRPEHAPPFYGDRTQSTVWQAQVVSAKEIATTVGSGVLLLDGKGGQLFIQSKAPKNKKLRQIRVAEGAHVLLNPGEHESSVWEVSRDGQHEHPTQKPVELVRRALENSSRPGEIVIDGFLGSGTTVIGAEMTARRCRAADIDPKYVQVAIERWQKFTGKQATLDGRTFEAIAAERKKGKGRHKGSPSSTEVALDQAAR